MVRGSEKQQVEGKTDEMMIVYLVWQPDSEEQRTTTTTDDNNKYRFGVVLKSFAFLENSWILQILEVEYKEDPGQIGSGSKEVLFLICFSIIHEIKWHKNLEQATGSLPKCCARPRPEDASFFWCTLKKKKHPCIWKKPAWPNQTGQNLGTQNNPFKHFCSKTIHILCINKGSPPPNSKLWAQLAREVKCVRYSKKEIFQFANIAKKISRIFEMIFIDNLICLEGMHYYVYINPSGGDSTPPPPKQTTKKWYQLWNLGYFPETKPVSWPSDFHQWLLGSDDDPFSFLGHISA